MKILIIDHYYPEFLKSFENSINNEGNFSYDEIKVKLMENMFGTADFYSKNLSLLGYHAEEIVVNFELLQRQWAKENNVPVWINIFKHIPYIGGRTEKLISYSILEAQVSKIKPDVLYVQCIGYLDKEIILKLRKHIRLLVGQIASPLPPICQLELYDLVVSSLPNIVKKLNDLDVPSEYLPLSFETSILDKIGSWQKKYPCTFIGGLSKNHLERINLLKGISEKIDLHVFGYGKEEIRKFTMMYKKHHGEIWGKNMYEVLAKSKITINKHIDISENYANNMRLFEATGMGVLLITDMKDNLHDLFKIGEEIVSYYNDQDLVNKIEYYSIHDDERKKIAAAGQARTITDHSYFKRMKELSIILDKYLSKVK